MVSSTITYTRPQNDEPGRSELLKQLRDVDPTPIDPRPRIPSRIGRKGVTA